MTVDLYCWTAREPVLPTFIWFVCAPAGVARIQILPHYDIQTIGLDPEDEEGSREIAVSWTRDAERQGMEISANLYVYETQGVRFQALFGSHDVRAPAQRLLADIHKRGEKFLLSP